MKRSHRIAAAAAGTGLVAVGGYVVTGAGRPAGEVLAADTAAQTSPQLQALQDALAELQAQTVALQDDLAAAQHQLTLADKARAAALVAAQAAAAEQAAAPPVQTVQVVRQAPSRTVPKTHARTGASGAGGAEHESEHDD